MDTSNVQALQRKLISVGLVVSGLLAGVFLMLITERRQAALPVEVQTVEFLQSAPVAANQQPGMAGVLQLNEQFKLVSREVRRAVVSIHSASSWYNLPCAILKRRSLEYRDRENLGSGVLISPQGFIVTNYHLVEDACALRVTFVNKEEYDAEVVGVDQSTDLAVVRIDLEPGHSLESLPLGNAGDVETGEWVLAVGNPMALTSTVTAGIISAIGRRVNVIRDDTSVEYFIQTDAAISPGNSGGALVNLRGELIGINTAIATQTGYNEGYGFAIPVDLVSRVASDLIAFGEVKRGYVGVGLDRVDASFAEELGLDRVRGVYLNFVRREGAAHQAGLREGDVVLSVEGLPVNEPNELQSLIAQYRPGDSLTLNVWRQGELRDHVVTLVGEEDPGVAEWITSISRSQPRNNPHGGTLYEAARWGLTLRALRQVEARLFGVTRGVLLYYVHHGSIADSVAVPAGVVVQSINSEAVNSVEEALQLLEDATEVELTILYEDGETEEFRLSKE